eukprot:gnl/TRDRNA2_/TRDRNA2_142430_c0_seq2.p1 gnl/TRDRNA2_/TRDRNA2_142430_c0~~gnl/TRDRNA2_/TRDRNA2_142430_c0_seq2.p1  ORF type:complete len:496 (-),score=107.06 gnl/TRDRNA2_/TRDRNA2_142430_c0_seq2:146-1633(-)
MELTDLAGTDGVEALETKHGAFLTKLSTEVESLIINLDQQGCQALLEQMDQHTPQGEVLVEMKKLRSLRITGALKRWQQLEQPLARLLHLLRPASLEDLALIGVDSMKIVRALLSHPSLHGTLVRLKLGLHGFHFLAQEDLLAMGAPLERLRAFQLFGVDANGTACRDGFCRMFLCASAFLDYLGQIQVPEEVEILHIANASILGEDQQIASLLRCLACFGQLMRLKLPLPSLPLSLRELLSLRLALPRLHCFVAELERIEGADVWPESEDWPPLTQLWPASDMITPLSMFSREFADLLRTPGQAAAEWERLSEREQRYWVDTVPRIRQMYRHCEHVGRGVGSLQEPASDTAVVALTDEGIPWRAVPEVRELQTGERTACSAEGDAFDAHRASTYGVEDWRAEERSALRGVLEVKASDVCKEKARLRKEPKVSKPSEGVELSAASGDELHQGVRATRDSGPSEAVRDLCEGGMQRGCPREEIACELGADTAAAEL